MSAPEHSRAMTTRSQPSRYSSSTPPLVNTLIWVLAWRGRSGSACRSRSKSPQSCTSTESTPRRQAVRAASSASGSSRSVSRVFRVRKTRTPRTWQYRMAVANSSSVKFLALRRALKSPQPRYTAPQPLCTAARRASGDPAGDRSSSAITCGCPDAAGAGRPPASIH